MVEDFPELKNHINPQAGRSHQVANTIITTNVERKGILSTSE